MPQHSQGFIAASRAAAFLQSRQQCTCVARSARKADPQCGQILRIGLSSSGRRRCLNAVGGMITVNTINVDPYGSESYAFAVMVGPEQGATADRVVVCAYDKRKQTAEVSGLF